MSSDQVTIICKTFDRPSSILRFVQSVRQFYAFPIVVADDSHDKYYRHPDTSRARKVAGVTWIPLPVDSGLATGRNAAVKAAKTPWVIVCDDDFVFTAKTNIELLVQRAMQHPAHISGGSVLNMSSPPLIGWVDWVEGWPITRYADPQLPHVDLDVCLNFFAAPRDWLTQHPWDPQFKIGGEHFESFARWRQAGARVIYTPEVEVGHKRHLPKGYKRHRGRGLLSAIHAFDQVTRSNRELTRPNIIVFGIGNSGTTIVVRQLEMLGWNAVEADLEYAEHVRARQINTKLARGQRAQEIRPLVDHLANTSGWVIKDPRFVHTLHHWAEWWPQSSSLPVLLWIRRPLKALIASRARRYPNDSGRQHRRWLKELRIMAEKAPRQYSQWQGQKVAVDYEDIAAAISLFDVTRGIR